MDKIDKHLNATGKLVRDSMKMLIESRKMQVEFNKEFDFKLNALIDSQRRTDTKLDRLIDSMQKRSRNGW